MPEGLGWRSIRRAHRRFAATPIPVCGASTRFGGKDLPRVLSIVHSRATTRVVVAIHTIAGRRPAIKW